MPLPTTVSSAASKALCYRRRLCYMLLVLSTTAVGLTTMFTVLSTNGISGSEWLSLALFGIALTLIASSFWNALSGFLIRLLCRDPIAFVFPKSRPPATTHGATAVIMPIYNEDPARTLAGLETTFASTLLHGGVERFEFFILSDSTDPEVAAEEYRRWQALCEKYNAWDKIHYRHRDANIGRKVGNIEDFCHRWGEQFEYMVVLDADSVMRGPTLRRLAGLMASNPQVGLIQTVPMPVGQHTLFARVLQFSGWLCSEMLTTGLSYWQLDDGCYFGHNAIIRLQPFIAHCRLPTLPGNGPLSGEILSHDFVEAALLRSQGWAIWTLPDGTGSYEELPSNVIDYAKRDRRWCQGNLQHLRLLNKPGMRLMSRLHLLMGALAYLASPLWLMLIVLGGLQLVEQAFAQHHYFQPNGLFPVWQDDHSLQARWLFAGTLALLLAPKLLGALLAWRDHGQAARLLPSLLLEVIFSALLAPVMMVFHTLFVTAIFCGQSVTWNPQVRGGRVLSLLEAWRSHRLQFLTGAMILAAIGIVAPYHLLWLLPVLLGLLLAAPLAVLGSSTALGLFCRRFGLLNTPKEWQQTPTQASASLRPLASFADDRP